jgi:hypothetical protein
MLLVPAILAGGCGSSKSTATTQTTPATQAVSPNTTPTAAPPTTTTPKPKVAETKAKPTAPAAKPAPKTNGSKPTPQEAIRTVEATLSQVPITRQYPKLMQQSFIVTCTKNSSTSACACFLRDFEMSPVEKGQSLAELLAVEQGVRVHAPLPKRIQRLARECKVGFA